MPIISVIIPLYNKEPYIARAIESIFQQTFQDFEIIVVDDGSTDKGAEVVKEFLDPRIHLIRQENRGVASARNRGATSSGSNLLAFLDADDEWLPAHLETIIRLRTNYPEAGMYSTPYKQYFSNNDIIIPKFFGIPQDPWEGALPNFFESCTFGEIPVCSSTVVIPKNIFIEFGGFQEEYWWGEDTDLWGRIAFKYPVVFSWKGGVILHRNAENRACYRKQSVLTHPFIVSAIEYVNSNAQVDAYYIKEFIAKEEMNQALFNMWAGNNRAAQTILKGCETQELKSQKRICQILSVFPAPLFIGLMRGKIQFNLFIMKLSRLK
jgi:glycosyltransferase involved in cell wall biosynthesis